MIDQVRRAQQALGEHNRGARVTREFCHDKEFSVRTDLSVTKKKKTPGIWGVTWIFATVEIVVACGSY